MSGKIGSVEPPYYNETHKTWMYSWWYGYGGTSNGYILETYIDAFFDTETNEWKAMKDKGTNGDTGGGGDAQVHLKHRKTLK